jgi:tetratricopeptide (TPR) repeat protein
LHYLESFKWFFLLFLSEQAKTYKDEGNDYFKEKDYKKAVVSYTEGLKKKCADPDLNAVLYTNRAAAQYYLGNLFHY